MIGALVLAAGLARRMGRSKLDLLLDGKPVLAHTLERLREAGLPALVVTGGHGEAVRRVAGDAMLVEAADHEEGLGGSLRNGVALVPEEWDGLLVVLGDMPFVRAGTYAALAAGLRGGAGAVVPVVDKRRGNPAGFARAHFAKLAGLTGDAGARALLDGMCVVEIEVEDRGVFRDIDVAADLDGECAA